MVDLYERTMINDITTLFFSVFDTSAAINSGSDRISSYSHGLPNTPPNIFTTTGSLQQKQEPQYYDGT